MSVSRSNDTVDFLIVGQGLVGTVLAYELERRGCNVLVMDQSRPHSASKVAAGLFNPFVFKWITKSWNADELLPVLLETYRAIEELTGAEFLHQTGIIRVIASQKEADSWAKKRKRPDFAAHIDEQASTALDQRFDKGWGAVAIKSAGWLDIPRMTAAFRDYLAQEGRIRSETFDHSQLEHGDPCRYGDITCRQVVFCEGAGVDQNPWFKHLHYRHTKGEVLDIEATDIALDACLNYGQFIVPRGNGVFRTGTTYNWKELDDVPTPEAEEKILRNHEAFFGKRPSIQAHRAGIRPTSADRRPFAGCHPDYPKLAILNATGSKGVLLAPWSARQLAEHLLNNKALHPEIDLRREIAP